MKGSEEAGWECSLVASGWVDVLVCGAKLVDFGLEGSGVTDVKGALFVIVPKRRTQAACGFRDGAVKYWCRTWFRKASVWLPGMGAHAVQECSGNLGVEFCG